MFTREPLFLKDTLLIDNTYGNRVLSKFQPIKGREFHSILQQFGPQNDIGIVIMGFADGYTTLHSAISHYHLQPDMQQHLRLLGKFVHILFCFFYKFCHGDHHLNNIMVKVDYNSPHEWYNGIHNGRAILIDFGRSTKIPDTLSNRRSTHEIIQDYLDTRNYTQLLRFIHHVGIPPHFHEEHVYRWFLRSEPNIDQNVALHQMLVNYMAFQDTPPHNKYKNISVNSMMKNYIFVPSIQHPAEPAEPAEPAQSNVNMQNVRGGYKKRSGYIQRKSRKSNRRK